jgi:hypothetical protein
MKHWRTLFRNWILLKHTAIVDLPSDEEFEDQRTGVEMPLEVMERLLSGLYV